jgi:hypothetical protein
MAETGKRRFWIFILFPSITMMLGWGLRGYIGGGPFGAMIPGAMVAICLSLMLKIPVRLASVVAVFGVVGIGLGGEMTYGQTLGFLLKPETMWLGTLGTTVKGSVWGLLGGVVLAMGFLYNRLPRRTIIIAFGLLLAGMLAGFKLINQPMIIYFSDPAKPRPESWGALLVGAMAVLIYLKTKSDVVSFRIISRFALMGMIGGGLGFGFGGFWMVLGSRLPDEVVFKEWWKAMEFTFGFIMGGFFGLAAWLSKGEIIPAMQDEAEAKDKDKQKEIGSYSILMKEFIVTLITGLLIFRAFSVWLDPVVDAGGVKGFSMIGLRDMAIIFSNYAFFGLIMVVAVIYFPYSAWQIAVALTFCHTVIDLMQDIYPDTAAQSLVATRATLVLLMTFLVSALTAWFHRRKKIIQNMFLLLVWSTVFVAFLRFLNQPEILHIEHLSFPELIFERFFVHIVFLTSAVIASVISFNETRES